MQKRYYWLKLKKDFFNSIRIMKLRSIAGGDTFTIIYLKMLLYTIDTDGVIQYQGVEKSIAEEIALALGEDSENVGLCLSYLCSVGLAEASQDEIFLPEAIENVGSEGASAERVRNHRERQALQCNTDVTQVKRICNVEKEKDTETEKEKRKNSRFTPPTLEEVKAYCLERNNNVDAEKFVDYYTANGWVQGKGKPVKDWKACIRTWEKNSFTNKPQPNKQIVPDYMLEASEQMNKPQEEKKLRWESETEVMEMMKKL